MAAENPPTRFLSEQLLLIGFALVSLWIAGLVRLLRHPRFRMLGLAAVVVILVLLVQRAKSYYAGPVYPVLLAAGAISFERFLSRQTSPQRRRRQVRSMIVALAISSVVAAPFALPVLPIDQMVRYHLDELRSDYAEMLGSACHRRSADTTPSGSGGHASRPSARCSHSATKHLSCDPSAVTCVGSAPSPTTPAPTTRSGAARSTSAATCASRSSPGPPSDAS